MNRLFTALLLVVLFTSALTGIRADVVHQLAGIDDENNTVVIEYGENKRWEVVFKGSLSSCPLRPCGTTNCKLPNTFHQPLGKGQFAFACSNGYVIVAENGKPAVPIELPTRCSWLIESPFLRSLQYLHISLLIEKQSSGNIN